MIGTRAPRARPAKKTSSGEHWRHERVRYLIAILLPPLGMLSVGKVFEAVLCLLLMFTIVGHPIAAIWAVLVVHSALADGRTRRIEKAARTTPAR
jgi:uncharacterized membrane protein YqaE (UPF0057 family)